MRHLTGKNRLKRNVAHRTALLKNLAQALIKHERIITTVAKAKALRPYVEKLITKGKKGDLANRRLVFVGLNNHKVLTHKLFEDVALRYKNRNGGYTRIYKIGKRSGDAAEMAMIELVEEQLEQDKK